MKKFLMGLGVFLMATPVILSFLYITDHKRTDNIEPEAAIESVKKKLDKKSIETITNFDNPKIEEIVFNTQPPIYCFDEKTDVTGKILYKITFNTTQDGLLGPMVFYVDKLSGALVGADYRS